MTFATLTILRTLLREQRGLVINFALTSLGRTALSMASILLIREFLAGALGEGTGLASILSGHLGERATLWAVALVFAGTFVGSSFLH